jgi:hypothetical protein
MNMTPKLLWLPIAMTLAIAPNALAGTIALYNLGSSDPGATAGNAVNSTTVDGTGGDNLTAFGSLLYSSNHDPLSGNTLSVQFNGSGYYLGPVVTNITNDFEIQAWVDPTADPGAGSVIAANGNTGVSGFGLITIGGEYEGIFGGAAFFDGGPIELNTWTLLTMTDVEGEVQMFQNGVLESTSFASPHAIPNPSFPADAVDMEIGANTAGGQLFTG